MNNIEQPTTNQQVIDFYQLAQTKALCPILNFSIASIKLLTHLKRNYLVIVISKGFTRRVQLAKYLQDLQVFTEPDRLFIVSGSQQALHLLAAMPFPNGKIIY